MDVANRAKRELFERLLKQQGLRGSKNRIAPQKRDGGPLPASFAQERLWFLNQLEPDSPAYNMPAAVRLAGPLSKAALEESLCEVIRRHETLRTGFANIDGQLMQVIAPACRRYLPVVDLRSADKPDQSRLVQELIAEESRRPFDLTRPGLIRYCLLRLANEEHILLLNMHHIISDGWSIGIFIKELATLYDACRSGMPSPLADLTIQYADFALWQREHLQGQVLDEQLTYWRKELGEKVPALEFPGGRVAPARRTSAGARHKFSISRDLAARLKSLSAREGATLFTTLLAAVKVLLFRYTGQGDITVGTPVAGRGPTQVKELMGLFVNTLVVRTRPSGDITFKEFLGRVKRTFLDAQAHEELPFEKLVEELHPQRGQSRIPFFQTMLVFQNAPKEEIRMGELEAFLLEIDRTAVKTDLLISIEEAVDAFRGEMQYSLDLLDAQASARMIENLITLLEAIAANPDARISQLRLLSENESRLALRQLNATGRDYPAGKCLHELFQEQVKQNPDSIAVVYESEAITFDELNRRSNRLAYHLRSLGVGPETPVALCTERSIESMVGLWAILKAGGAYLPMDPSYPSHRLDFMLEDSRAAVLLTQSRFAEAFTNQACAVILLDREWSHISQGNDSNLPAMATPANLAYIIYTSGSTGKPKGVMVEHASVVNLVHALNEAIYRRHSGRLRVGLNASTVFDGSVKQIVQLVNGHTLCIVPEGARTDGKELLSYIRRNELTVLDCVPSQLNLLTTAGLGDGISPWPAVVLVGGEQIDLPVWDRIKNIDINFYNVYGPTEATVDTSASLVRAEQTRPVIGRPLGNIQTYLLDEYANPAPIGACGELSIGGAGVARGYLNGPGLTAQQFVPDPFTGRASARLYKSGDLCRLTEDGEIAFVSRIDQQVKVRGYRVETGEIQSLLKEHPGISEAVVVAQPGPAGERCLVAYLVSSAGSDLSAGEIRSFLKNRVPDYMVPAFYVWLEALPLLPNGKVDRKALRLPEDTSADSHCAKEPPRNDVEEVVAGVWADVLGLENFGIYDNFFDLGGHSLAAARILSRIRAVFEFDLPIRLLFEDPTIAGLSAAIVENAPDRSKVEETASLLVSLAELPDQEFQLVASDDNPRLR